jgi:hypothetical protein
MHSARHNASPSKMMSFLWFQMFQQPINMISLKKARHAKDGRKGDGLLKIIGKKPLSQEWLGLPVSFLSYLDSVRT